MDLLKGEESRVPVELPLMDRLKGDGSRLLSVALIIAMVMLFSCLRKGEGSLFLSDELPTGLLPPIITLVATCVSGGRTLTAAGGEFDPILFGANDGFGFGKLTLVLDGLKDGNGGGGGGGTHERDTLGGVSLRDTGDTLAGGDTLGCLWTCSEVKRKIVQKC